MPAKKMPNYKGLLTNNLNFWSWCKCPFLIRGLAGFAEFLESKLAGLITSAYPHDGALVYFTLSF